MKTDSEQEAALIYKPSLAGKIFAWFFSIIFHPLFIPVLGVAILAYLIQGYYLGIPDQDKGMILLRVAVNTIFFPLITVLLLKGLGFIKSIYLKTQKERIIPYVATNIFYFWIFLVFVHQDEVPQITTSFILGIFLASSLGLVLNSFFKISMHALGMGSVLGLLLVIIYSGTSDTIFLTMAAALLITGIVCTARLIISDHTYFDLAAGLLIGIACQGIANLFF